MSGRPIKRTLRDVREAIRTVGLNGVSKTKFVVAVASLIVLDCKHLEDSVEAFRVAQDNDLAEGRGCGCAT